MIPGVRSLRFLAVVVVASLSVAFVNAQKVKVGYDKSIDFSRYKSYTIERPSVDPPRPVLYANVVGAIQNELDAKGLANKATGGDLMVVVSGGLDYGLNSLSMSDSCANCKAPLLDPMEWTGETAPPGGVGSSPMPEGTVEVTFIDRAVNKVVWAGTVTQKLDPNKKQKSLEKSGAAIKKLLMDFPPKNK